MGADHILEREVVIKRVEYHIWDDGGIISLGADATKEDVDQIRNWLEQVKEGTKLPTIIAGAPLVVIQHDGTFRDKETVITSGANDAIYDLFLGR